MSWQDGVRREGERGERRLPGLTSSGLYLPASQCQVGKLSSSASSERSRSVEGKGVLQQIPLANCWSNEQFGSKLAPVSHCSLILTSDLDGFLFVFAL